MMGNVLFHKIFKLTSKLVHNTTSEVRLKNLNEISGVCEECVM